MIDEPYKVYVQQDNAGHITDINSSAFLSDTAGWVEIDSGYGDKYHHAQGNFLQKPILTDGGAYRYKLTDGVLSECTAAEIAQQEAENLPAPTLEHRVGTLEAETAETREALDMLLSGVTE